jgi:hypothetical protein
VLRLFRGRVAGGEEREPPSRGSLLLWQSAAALLADGNRQAIVRQIREEVGVPAKHFEQLYQGLIERFAELVQLLPASENHHHAHSGGLLDHSLDVAQKAVAIRRGHLLPPGAEPEEVARASDRWTYAVFSAGLLHDVGKAVLLGEIEQFAGGQSGAPGSAGADRCGERSGIASASRLAGDTRITRSSVHSSPARSSRRWRSPGSAATGR